MARMTIPLPQAMTTRKVSTGISPMTIFITGQEMPQTEEVSASSSAAVRGTRLRESRFMRWRKPASKEVGGA